MDDNSHLQQQHICKWSRKVSFWPNQPFSSGRHQFLLLWSSDKHSYPVCDCMRCFSHKKIIKRASGRVLSNFFMVFIWKTYNLKDLSGNVTLVRSNRISLYGFTWDSRAWIFSSSSLILSSFFWDSAWASCRALNSSSNCKKRDRSLSMCT